MSGLLVSGFFKTEECLYLLRIATGLELPLKSDVGPFQCFSWRSRGSVRPRQLGRYDPTGQRLSPCSVSVVSGFGSRQESFWSGTGAGRTSTADARSAVLASISGPEERTVDGYAAAKERLSSAKERVTRIGR